MSSMLLGNRYQLQEPIGRGLMAIVYRGIDIHTDHVVAIKVLRETYSSDPKFARRFQKEAEVMASLQHPNIVQVYDSGQTDGTYFTVMELVEGTDLRRYLCSRGILDAHSALIIAHEVARGLGAAHRRGMVHRAVTPRHILLGRDGRLC
jgi:eukaryotic-like serine/threonine-protein kinase